MTATLSIALSLRKAGIACIPCKADKRPVIKWREYQTRLPTEAELGQFFSNGASIAIITKDIYCLDFEEKYLHGILTAYGRRAAECGLDELLGRLILQQTPSGGFHMVFRCDFSVELGNQKLACRPATTEEKEKDPHVRQFVLIETRGAGGYFLIDPSPGYRLIRGDWANIPEITEEERDALFSLARSFDEIAPKEAAPPAPASRPTLAVDAVKPGDDYDARSDMPALLRSHGWTQAGSSGKYWTRPGKKHGISASWDVIPRRLYVFSTSTEFQSQHVYRPWHVFALLKCGGDFGEAARRLRREGFGAERPTAPALVGSVGACEPPRTEGMEPLGPDEGGQKPKPRSKSIADLKLPDRTRRDAVNLLGDGFLRRGQTGLLAAATGIGKSVLAMQASELWACGRDFFGIRPQSKLKVLIVQSENDEEDLAEMRDGISKGIQFDAADLEDIRHNVRTLRSFKSGVKFAEDITPDIESFQPDLVLIDPLFAFAGIDLSKDQAAVSAFLRELIQPFVLKHNCGLILVHHTNKPQTGKEKGEWAAGDFAYVGSGSSELANFSRFVIAVRSIGSSTVFELRIGKRWKRAGIADAEGKPLDRVLIKHSDKGICWLDADETDLEASEEPKEKRKTSAGRPEKLSAKDLSSLLKFAGIDGVKTSNIDRIAAQFKCSPRTVWEAWGKLKGDQPEPLQQSLQ